MSGDVRSGLAAAAAVVILVGATSGAAFGEEGYAPARLASGHPDLQGDWTNTSMTRLERGNPSLPLVLDEETRVRLETARARQSAAANARTDPSEGAPAVGGAIGGYNQYWINLGDHLAVINGQARSSWIVEPDDGRMPVSEAGQARIEEILARRGYTDPEGLNPADRCLVGSRGSGGPPMLNNIYNNTYQIVQTPDAVVINVEMMHDARIVRMGEDHKASPLSQWLGDSVGRWDGDTLVVTTRNWKRDHGNYEPIFLSDQAVVTERFTRVGDDELFYEFTIDDPVFYDQTWRGEMIFHTATGPVHEYACHEGNYAMTGILAGARRED